MHFFFSFPAEGCAITVHENSCRDQASDCTRFKVPKSVPPLGSRVSLASLSIAGSAKPNHPIGSTSTSALPSTATLAATPATSASTSVIATGSSSSSWSASASAQMAQVVVPHSSSSTVSTVTTPTAAFVAPSISSPLFNSRYVCWNVLHFIVVLLSQIKGLNAK